jgi:glycerol-3-phosphate cytidylyltransferase
MSARGQRVGYVPGVYDLFHIGHLNVLKNSRQFCDYLIAGVVS